ncbi:MAG TPA: GNAT family N-acetyltransferase, partial [Solirubrobacteraceae bacterium]|nr:GNAT family N-acetyltransferase [Solirubrobacteraceae bacterium]
AAMPAPDVREILPPDTALAFRAMRELRPHWGEEAEFVRRVDELQRPAGYRIVGSFDPGSPHAAAVAGFREGHNLAWGHFVYVDDLSSHPDARGRGHGGAVLDWVHEEAARLGVDDVHLDSGVGPEREDAHRLYFNKRYRIASYHFVRPGQ